MNHLENEYFQKEVEIEIKRQMQETFHQRRYEEPKTIEAMKIYISEESQKLFKKAFAFLISMESEQVPKAMQELKDNKEILREKMEANQKMLSKILEFKGFLDSFQ